MSWTNAIFRGSYTGLDGNNYYIFFTPGYETDLSSPTTYDFPDGFIDGDSGEILDRSFEKDVPLGIENPITFEITLDMELLTGDFDTGQSWDDVKTSILNGCSDNTRTVNSVDHYINNRWKKTNADTGSVIFDGFQNYVPKEKLTYDSEKKQMQYKISCVDAFHVVSERLKHTDLADLTVDYQKKEQAIYMAEDANAQQTLLYRGTENINFSLIGRLYLEIISKFNDLYSALVRTAGSTFMMLSDSGGKSGAVTSGSATVTVANVAGFNIGQIVTDDQTMTGTLASGSAIISVSDTGFLLAGMSVSGTGIPAGTTIATIDSLTQFTMTANATATGAETLTIGSFPANTKIVSIDSSTTFTIDSNATVTGSIWVQATEIVPFTAFDLHGHYDYARDWAFSTNNQLNKDDVYISAGVYQKDYKAYNYYWGVGPWGYDIDADGLTVTVADTSILSAGDVVVLHWPGGYPYYMDLYTTIDSITDATTFVLSDKFFGSANDRLYGSYKMIVRHATINLVGGMIHGDNGLPKYDSLYDFLHKDLFSNLGKGIVDFNPAGYDLALNVYKLKEPIKKSSLAASDIKQAQVMDIERGTNFIASAENKLIEKSQADNATDAYKINNIGNANNNSLSLEPCFQYDLLEIGRKAGFAPGSKYLTMILPKAYDTMLFNYAQSTFNSHYYMFKIAHVITVDLGQGDTYIKSSTRELTNIINWPSWPDIYDSAIKGTPSSDGRIKENAGYELAQKLADLCSKQNAPVITFKVSNNVIPASYIGSYISAIDLADILNSSVPASYGSVGIITSVKQTLSYKEDTNEVKIWIF